jgi:hypothetical protein
LGIPICFGSKTTGIALPFPNFDKRIFWQIKLEPRGKGCSGNVIGVDGTLNLQSTARMAVALRVEGRNAIDFDCGNGRFMAMALAMGAFRVSSIEHPQNVTQQLIFCAVLEEMLLDLAGFQLTVLNAEWIPLNIDKVHCPGSFLFLSCIQIIQSIILGPPFGQVRVMPDTPGGFPNCSYLFWVGMPPVTQRDILQLCALCPSVDTLAVFRCRNWNRPEKGNADLIMQTCLPLP